MPKIGEARRPTAVGAYIFAGGFTVGVTQAGFKVLGHLEDGDYGVATARANMPWLEVHTDPAAWPLDNLVGVDFVYSNPPCAAWSAAGVSSSKKWLSDPRVSCTRKSFSLLESLRPSVWCWESVARAYTLGRPLVDEFTGKAAALGYSVTHLLVDARCLGCPQRRSRFFMVAHRVPLEFKNCGGREVTTREALAGVPADPRQPLGRAAWVDLLPHLGPGREMRRLFEEMNPELVNGSVGRVVGRPSFQVRRLDPDDVSFTLTGGAQMIHPYEDRYISVPESAALCGYPPGYEFTGSLSQQYAQVAQAVMPPVGRWLAEAVRKGLSSGLETSGVVRTVDLRPGRRGTAGPRRPARTERTAAAASGPAGRRPLSTAAVTGPSALFDDCAPSGQPTRKSTLPRHVDPDREFDLTSLEASGYGYRVHRDYAAHFFRWGFARRFCRDGPSVLDVGCGTDCPFVKTFVGGYPDGLPSRYIGVDLNPLPRAPRRGWARFMEKFNFLDRHGELGQFDLVVCFEVIEHMRMPDGRRLLAGLRSCLSGGGRLLLSTPVFDGRAAANHLHEWTVPDLKSAVADAGLAVAARFGTFANRRDIDRVCSPAERELMDRLGEFYSNDVLACFLAPKYPDASRNNVWVLVKE